MFNDFKTVLTDILGISRDALHIHLGLALFFGLMLLFRKPASSLVPWFGLLAFELVNELLDIFHWHGGTFSIEIGDTFKDIFSTMLWPTVVVLVARGVEARRARAAD